MQKINLGLRETKSCRMTAAHKIDMFMLVRDMTKKMKTQSFWNFCQVLKAFVGFFFLILGYHEDQ